MAVRQPTASDGDTARVTITLPADLIAAVERAVRSGQAASPDVLMADALRHELAARAHADEVIGAAPAQKDLLEGDLLANRAAILRQFRAGVQAEIAAHLAADRPVFSSGLRTDAGKLFMDMPDGRRFEYHFRADGSREIVREVPR